MIITQKDIELIEKQIEEVNKFEFDNCIDENIPQTPVFFANYPHLVMPLGFDEYRSIDIEFDIEGTYGIESDLAFEKECLFRKRESGEWLWFEGIDNGILHFEGSKRKHEYISAQNWVKTLKEIRKNPLEASSTLWLPSNWTNSIKNETDIKLSKTNIGILEEIAKEKKDLSSINWRQLEELIAELLRSQGMEIIVTPNTKDGGRDIIARGEFIPGEPMLMAIEVKHKKIVGLHDFQKAMKANEDFPTLMLATSGKFSSGVIREKNKNRHNLRLFLKDGIALTQWIEAYRMKDNKFFH